MENQALLYSKSTGKIQNIEKEKVVTLLKKVNPKIEVSTIYKDIVKSMNFKEVDRGIYTLITNEDIILAILIDKCQEDFINFLKKNNLKIQLENNMPDDKYYMEFYLIKIKNKILNCGVKPLPETLLKYKSEYINNNNPNIYSDNNKFVNVGEGLIVKGGLISKLIAGGNVIKLSELNDKTKLFTYTECINILKDVCKKQTFSKDRINQFIWPQKILNRYDNCDNFYLEYECNNFDDIFNKNIVKIYSTQSNGSSIDKLVETIEI